MKAIKLLFIITILTTSLNLFAGDTKRVITLGVPSKKGTVVKPHAPAYIPLFCELDGNQIVITSDYPTLIVAEVTANDGFDAVGYYCATKPATAHTFCITPQNTTLTIEIEVDGKTYTGEFFY